MTEFLQDNWIALLSMVVALVGGVPGIIELLRQLKNRPIFRFRLVNIIIGEAMEPETGERNAMVFLTGTASNEGAVPLSPAYFELRARLGSGWIRFEKMLIAPDAKFPSEVEQIHVEEPNRADLQRFNGTIAQAMPVHGHLMFVSKLVPIDKLRHQMDSLRLELTCVDIFGKKHETEVAIDAARNGQGTIYPKHGLTIERKT